MATGCLLDSLASSPVHPGNTCYSCSIKFFHLIIPLVLALGESWQHWCLQVCPCIPKHLLVAPGPAPPMYSYSTDTFLAAGCMRGGHKPFTGYHAAMIRLSRPWDQTAPQKKGGPNKRWLPVWGGKARLLFRGQTPAPMPMPTKVFLCWFRSASNVAAPEWEGVNKHLLVALRASASVLLPLSWQQRACGVGTNLSHKLLWTHGNEHHGIDPNMSNSGHHDCSKKSVFLCTAVKLQSCHMLAHWTQHTGPSPPFNQHSFEQYL